MKQQRLDSLADGIFAIVMTILVFEIRVPESLAIVTDNTLWNSLVVLYPLFLSYLLSFSLLFTYWRSHQYIASVLAKNTDIPLSNLSALFFFFVGLVPFSSHLLGAYHYTQVAIGVFALNIILIGLSLYAMRHYVIASESIKNARFTKIENEHANMRILIPVMAAIIAFVVSFTNKEIALLFFTLAILFNLSRRSTRYLFACIDPLRKKKMKNKHTKSMYSRFMNHNIVRTTTVVSCIVLIAALSFNYFAERARTILAKQVALQQQAVEVIPEELPQESSDACYYSINKVKNGLYDETALRIHITNSTAMGEFENTPAGKEEKYGMFKGITQIDEEGNGTINATWSSRKNGILSQEELVLFYDESGAQQLVGDMTKNSDGLYTYKDKTKATKGKNIPTIDCNTFNDTKSVQQYIYTNISSLATNKASLGGKWMTTQIAVDPKVRKAYVAYEDGHNAHIATLEYTIDANNNVKITKFTILK